MKTFHFRVGVKAILESSQWENSVRCPIGNTKVSALGKGSKNKGRRRTPLRMLIKDMPDLASLVLDKGVRSEGQADDEDFFIDFYYGLLDDTYVVVKTEDEKPKPKRFVGSTTKIKCLLVSSLMHYKSDKKSQLKLKST